MLKAIFPLFSTIVFLHASCYCHMQGLIIVTINRIKVQFQGIRKDSRNQQWTGAPTKPRHLIKFHANSMFNSCRFCLTTTGDPPLTPNFLFIHSPDYLLLNFLESSTVFNPSQSKHSNKLSCCISTSARYNYCVAPTT